MIFGNKFKLGEGSIVLVEFPEATGARGKLRPALVLIAVPGKHNDWLVCFITTQFSQYLAPLDEVILQSDSDFESSGLKKDSIVRAARIATTCSTEFRGVLGNLPRERTRRIRERLAQWLLSETD